MDPSNYNEWVHRTKHHHHETSKHCVYLLLLLPPLLAQALIDWVPSSLVGNYRATLPREFLSNLISLFLKHLNLMPWSWWGGFEGCKSAACSYINTLIMCPAGFNFSLTLIITIFRWAFGTTFTVQKTVRVWMVEMPLFLSNGYCNGLLRYFLLRRPTNWKFYWRGTFSCQKARYLREFC